ncbi:MAG: thioredoxin-disulfide reductase [Rhodobacteraceae bacterium]|nr:thioredoxin-disulfide reductase [Paracoccaceae bacterium]MDE2916799.1 thioredoxin-disulfide reductase [Paracoccaceae bacterium]MYG42953.1 thioredoxin-disulfide reductase [Paracoccaceae bacterium]
MPENFQTDVLIIGSGPAGYTAGVYASRAMLEPILVQGIQPGGQLTITTDVENWPGDTMVLGPDLMMRMEEHARSIGVNVIQDHIIDVDLKNRPFRATGDSGSHYHAKALILATGAQAKWLGLPSEDYFKGHGVSACATCDGFFFRGQEVVVVGGGNTAVEEALFLTKFASRVTLIHRRDELRADKVLQQRLFENEKIVPLWNHVLVEITGENDPKSVTGLIVRNTQDGSEKTLSCTGVFIAIGHTPSSELFVNNLETREGGYIVTEPGTTRTSIPGVFAAGDLVDSTYRQAVTSAGMGCMAALDAVKFLAESG